MTTPHARERRERKVAQSALEGISQAIKRGRHYVAKVGDTGRWAHGVHSCDIDPVTGEVSLTTAGGRVALLNCKIDSVSVREHAGGVVRVAPKGATPVLMFASK